MLSYMKHVIGKQGPRLPLYLILHATYVCNAKCRFCFLSDKLNQRRGEELTMEEMEALSRGLKELLWLTIGGGEPFLRSSLPEICALFARRNHVRRIAIPTNASRPRRTAEMVEEILRRCPSSMDLSVGLSLDGVGEEHDRIRLLRGSFDKLVRSHDLLLPLRDRFPNFSLGILTTLSELNVASTQEIGDFVRRRLKVDWHTFEMMRGTGPEPVRPPSAEEYAQVLPYIQANLRHYRFGKGLRSRVVGAVKRYQPQLALRTLQEERQVLPCYAGRINGVVDALGNVGLCELRPSIGNLRSAGFDFAKIWHSQRADQQRASIQADECHCTHCIFQSTSILFSPKAYPALAANQRRMRP